MKIAIVGTQGVPNQYGGFETLATFLAKHLSDQMDMTIYCSAKDLPTGSSHFFSASLRYVHISSHGFSGMLYDMFCLYEAVKKNDVVLFLGFGAGYLLPFLTQQQRRKIILNFGGLDWKRNKWSWLAKRIIHFSERLLVSNITHIIADNLAIEKYKIKRYLHEDKAAEQILLKAIEKFPSENELLAQMIDFYFETKNDDAAVKLLFKLSLPSL